MQVLGKWKIDHADQLKARDQIFKENPNDISVILEFFLDVMLYQPLTARDLEEEDQSNKHLGLSKQAVEDVTNNGKVQWTTTKLKDAKVTLSFFFF